MLIFFSPFDSNLSQKCCFTSTKKWIRCYLPVPHQKMLLLKLGSTQIRLKSKAKIWVGSFQPPVIQNDNNAAKESSRLHSCFTSAASDLSLANVFFTKHGLTSARRHSFWKSHVCWSHQNVSTWFIKMILAGNIIENAGKCICFLLFYITIKIEGNLFRFNIFVNAPRK